MASQTPAPPDVYNIVIKHVDMMVKPMDQKYCELKQADNAKDFTICHRALGGETNLRYLPEDNTATCVIKSINICLAMLRDQQVRNALTEIAASYSQTYPTAWYLQEASPKHKGDMNRVTDDFLLKILERFPILWVDHTLECLRMYAVAMRRPWHGDFKASSQCIMINVYNVDFMVRAAIKEKNATSPAERKKHHENYQAFLFLYANSLLHEIGHLFITYLSRGQQSCHTPTNMKVPTIFDKHPEIGEAGRKLEALVFGGTMEYMVDPDKNFDWYDCGAAYLVHKNSVGEIGRWRVLPETIKRTVKCEFEFPYDHEKDEEKRKLEAIDPEPGMVKFMDPMGYRPPWHPYVNSFSDPAEFFSVLCGDPSN